MGMKAAATVLLLLLLLLLFSYLHISAASTLNTTMDSAYSQKRVFDTNKTSTPLGFGGRGGRGGSSFRGGKGRGGGYAGGHGFDGSGHLHGHGGNKKSWSTKGDPCCTVGGVVLMAAIGTLLLE